ncbi:hypothetical protein ACOMHN_017973 [Nucella lapillus]
MTSLPDGPHSGQGTLRCAVVIATPSEVCLHSELVTLDCAVQVRTTKFLPHIYCGLGTLHRSSTLMTWHSESLNSAVKSNQPAQKQRGPRHLSTPEGARDGPANGKADLGAGPEIKRLVGQVHPPRGDFGGGVGEATTSHSGQGRGAFRAGQTLDSENNTPLSTPGLCNAALSSCTALGLSRLGEETGAIVRHI